MNSEKHGLYNKSQKDSEVEEKFVTNKLEFDDNVLFFFQVSIKIQNRFSKNNWKL